MRRVWGAVLTSLLLVLTCSCLVTFVFLPAFKNKNARTYVDTNCLTDQIQSGDNIFTIAKNYRDGQAAVEIVVDADIVKVKGDTSDTQSVRFFGSGVCVASKGYQTKLSNGYTASQGSYVVTNYHVIEAFDMPNEYTNCQLYIITEEEMQYNAELIWFDKNLDVALVYCDYVNLNYVRMKDRVVECSKKDRLDYELIFTIGTPINTAYLNRLTIGIIASNNPMQVRVADTVYILSGGGIRYNQVTGTVNIGYNVLSNFYEDVVDMTTGITPGNSGGGCFDKNGYLVGLATLSADVSQTNGNQINNLVPIYPVMQVLDKLIDNNENGGKHQILTLRKLNYSGVSKYGVNSLNLTGFDEYEADAVRNYQFNDDYPLAFYFFDGKTYTAETNEDKFAFKDEGFYLLNTTSSKFTLPQGAVITSCKVNNKTYSVNKRNDLIYALLRVDSGMSLSLSYKNGSDSKTVTLTF